MLKLTSLRALCGVTLAALALAVPAAAQSSNGYTIIDLGTGNTRDVDGEGINASGQVAGNFGSEYPTYDPTYTSSGVQAFRWSGTTLTNLNGLGGPSTYARGINDSGQISGWAYTKSSGTPHAALWNGITPTDLGTLGGANSYAYGINNSGQVAGASYVSGNATQHAFRYSGGTMTDLGTLGGNRSSAFAINNSGQVTGYASLPGNTNARAVIWTGTTAKNIDTLGGYDSLGYAINNSGQVAGAYTPTATSDAQAFFYSGSTMVPIGTLGGTYSVAYGMNNSGDVVGGSTGRFPGINLHAFLYTGGRLVDANTLLPTGSGWILAQGDAINDNGWITGEGIYQGQSHAFLLRPNAVPEPSTLALFSVGAFVLGTGWQYRRKSTAPPERSKQ